MKILLTVIIFCVGLISFAQKPAPVPAKKAFTLMRFFEKNHYSPVKWNDSASAILFDKWMETVDDDYLFFTEPEFIAFKNFRYQLDDEILGKSWNFLPMFEKTVSLRFKKIDSLVKLYLSKPIDFSKPDIISWPFTTYAKTEQEFANRYQHYLKWKLLSKIYDNLGEKDSCKINGKFPADFSKMEIAARAKLQNRESSFLKNFTENISQKIQDDYLNCIAWCYDPHSNYMNIQAREEFETEMSAFTFSTGMDISKNEEEIYVVEYLEPGGSAWRSGKIHTGDQVMKINTETKSYNVSELSEEEIENLLGGNIEEGVEVNIKTPTGEMLVVKLMKEKISNDDNKVKSYVLKGNKNIGYINLPGFYSRAFENKEIAFDGCAGDVSKEILKLKKDTIAGLVLDLRFNGGGSMWEAIQLAGIFIDAGPVLSVKEKSGKVTFYKDPNRGTIYDGPLLILVNGASASASELLSAVLQDYNRALIVGSTTYGKGTAQVILPLDTNMNVQTGMNEDFVKITQQKFYRINGSTTQWKGVIPDIVFPDFFDGEEKYKERSNKSALLPDISKTGLYTPLAALPVSNLKSKSESRVSADNYFKAIQQIVRWKNSNINGRTISLQWKEYLLQNKQILENFGKIPEGEAVKTELKIRNNNFEIQRLKTATDKTKEINHLYLDHMESDQVLAEAWRIMMDWTK